MTLEQMHPARSDDFHSWFRVAGVSARMMAESIHTAGRGGSNEDEAEDKDTDKEKKEKNT